MTQVQLLPRAPRYCHLTRTAMQKKQKVAMKKHRKTAGKKVQSLRHR
ncbi:MAG: hypothetical protein V1916_01760 [Patescibacteria group bacterium]